MYHTLQSSAQHCGETVVTDKLKLFGRTIQPSERKRTLTDQVYEILQDEIRRGRWQVGDRLPSVGALAKETGLSGWPLQSALELLRSEGYVAQKRGAGTFLVSQSPDGVPLPEPTEGEVTRTIGIAIPHNFEAPRRLQALVDAAHLHNYAIEIKYLDNGDGWTEIDKVGSVFSEDVTGVISLHSFPHAEQKHFELAPDQLPFVYLGSTTSTCLPVVCGDTHNGFYRLTKRVIELGHREIVCVGEPDESCREIENRYLGYERAMEDCGLTPDRKAHDRSLDMRPGDLHSIREFLEYCDSATAIICTRNRLFHDLVAVSEMIGRHIPEDLSIVGHGPPNMHAHDDDRRAVVLDYDQRLLVETCFELLEKQRLTRKCGVSRVLIAPTIAEGDSLAPPPGKKQKVAVANR
jgi:GntR family transcriptional regulator of arabinose operon